MKRHICRVVLFVSIVALVTAFAGSASAANRHRYHHPQVPRYNAALRGGSCVPPVYSPYPNFFGHGGGTRNYSGYAAPHYDYHYAAPHHDYHHSHHGW